MFGGRVNNNGTDVCVAGEEKECTGGTEGTGNGEFSWAIEKAYIAVGPGGDVYVGNKARVEVFEQSGAWKENISLSALSSEGKVTALAVNTAGDVYVKDEGVPGVREFEPDGVEMGVRLDETGGEAVESIALDGSGNVFISEGKAQAFEPCKCDFLEYGPSGEELESFGTGTLVVMTAALAFDESNDELYVYGSNLEGKAEEFGTAEEYGHYGVWAFPVPAPGPSIESGSEKATPELRGAASFEATINP